MALVNSFTIIFENRRFQQAKGANSQRAKGANRQRAKGANSRGDSTNSVYL